MAQDIRELFKNDNSIPKGKLSQGHQDRFAARLNALHQDLEDKSVVTMNTTKSKFPWMKIAAIFIVALSIGILGYNQLSGEIPSEVGNLTNLVMLYFNDNQLTGIPNSICNLDLEW